MSVQKAKEFLVKVSTDKEVAEKAREAHEASLLAVAREFGFDIEAEDLREAMSEIDLLEDLDLTATDADQVAGGYVGHDSLYK